ncbi:MAG: hypothetical protein A2X93_09885 [Deltaproteobacteria bacterium GWC2_56_8]|nr:MAG: hypothetical protein A2X99_10520 [Deltaproteobacteria bacterium GWB2_55_19]OGP33281.1 MAG: hypothetical protein A2X93_09885 [Deltaproteobacteria bacterium GWC2_56_8]HAO94333.1 hypothetical protein [Deltaproteobacteria bacterium]
MKTRNLSISLFFLVFLLLPSMSAAARAGVNNSDYWIGKLKRPDKAVMTAGEIEALNRSILEGDGQMADVSVLPDLISGSQLQAWLNEDHLPTPQRYDADGIPLDDGFFAGLAHNMNLSGVADENPVRFGYVIERADIRAFPEVRPVLKSPEKAAFDTFQYSSIAPGEPAALLHTSSDGLWGFFQTRIVRGWLPLEKVALGEREALGGDGDVIVVTGSSVDIFVDLKFKETVASVPMGAVFYPSKRRFKGAWAIRYPAQGADGLIWKDAYIKKGADVSKGFLPYTRRNVIRQAFKMLGEEYGWGGRDGKRDCSEFIRSIFATMSIRLPRNSSRQAVAGDVRAHEEYEITREDMALALDEAEPGITLLGTPGHIMLYLGERKGTPYVIHQIFGYMDNSRLKVINKVAVTDLNIGSRSKSGPFRERLRSVNAIVKPAMADGDAYNSRQSF